jgi:dolichyl-diphosphooligosaccharide--protein glycosyltransferase
VAYEVCDKLDVDYVLILYGGMAGYTAGDDIGKLIWIVRTANTEYPNLKQ